MSTSGAEISSGVEAAPSVSTRALFFSLYPSIMLPMFLASLDQTIVATALPSIAGALGDVERISWVVVSYLIATTIAAPVYGRLGDILGRRRVLFVALFLFIGASLLCAAANTVLLLTAARLLQGLGGGGLMTLSQALIGESVPARERGRFQGYLASIYMSASTFGPVVGGYLTQHLGWQSVFLINLPLGALALLLMLRLPRRAGAGGRLHFDVTGVALFTAVVAPTLLALEQGQRFSATVLPLVTALAGIAVVALLLLIRQERRARMPLLPLGLLRQGAIWRCDALAACVGATLLSLITFVPIYLEVVYATDPSQTGFLMLPLTACVAVGSMFTGQIVARTGRTAIFPSYGLILVGVMLVVIALFATRLSRTELPWAFGLTTLGLGTAMPVVNMTVQMVAGPRQLGAASASVQFSRSIGSALGTAIVGAVLFATLAGTDRTTAALFTELVQRGPAVLAGLSPARILEVQGQIAGAFRAAFAAIACFAFAGVALAWSIPVRRLI